MFRRAQAREALEQVAPAFNDLVRPRTRRTPHCTRNDLAYPPLRVTLRTRRTLHCIRNDLAYTPLRVTLRILRTPHCIRNDLAYTPLRVTLRISRTQHCIRNDFACTPLRAALRTHRTQHCLRCHARLHHPCAASGAVVSSNPAQPPLPRSPAPPLRCE